MWTYWLMFLLPAAGAVVSRPPRKPWERERYWDARWILVGAVLSMLIGFREEVGGDWFNYLRVADWAASVSLLEALELSDPGYMLVTWVSEQLGWGIYGTNLACGVLFAMGLIRLCLTLPRPWLSIAISMPYLVIVVAMGYTRQGVALGLVMAGLASLQKKSPVAFALWVFAAVTFHKSAIFLLPIGALANTRNRYLTGCLLLLASLVGYYLFLQDSMDALYENYVDSAYQSEGALVRVLMNALPAMILLLWRRRFGLPPTSLNLWLWFARLSVLLVVLLLVGTASTAVDRVALYFLPLQLVVFSHLPDLSGANLKRYLVVLVLAYYATVQFVWLNFAVNAPSWLPYRFAPLETMF